SSRRMRASDSYRLTYSSNVACMASPWLSRKAGRTPAEVGALCRGRVEGGCPLAQRPAGTNFFGGERGFWPVDHVFPDRQVLLLGVQMGLDGTLEAIGEIRGAVRPVHAVGQP